MSSNGADDLVRVRSENLDRYTTNFLQQAVCELRFPTLMSLGATKLPNEVVDLLRHDYPYLESANEVTLGISGAQHTNPVHIFRAAKMNWTVTVKQSAFVIETTRYTKYEQMRSRILAVAEAASKVIDSDFFTRIGLRYINVIDADENPADGWVNSALVTPIAEKVFGGIREFAGKIQAESEEGGITLQHGISFRSGKLARPTYPDYTIDIDSFRNEISVGEVGTALDAMHAQAFNVFDWAIGPKAKEYLTSGKRETKNS